MKESSQTISKSIDTLNSALETTVSDFTDTTLLKLLNTTHQKQGDSLDHGTLYTLHENLKKSFSLNEYIEDIGIFIEDPHTDYLCSVNFISDNFEKDYKNSLYHFEEMSYADFKNLLVNSPNRRYIHSDYFAGLVNSQYDQMRCSAHLLFMVYPLNSSKNFMNAYAVMQLNLDKICKELLSSRYCSSYISLYDSSDNLIYTTDNSIASAPFNTDLSYYNEESDNTWYIQNTIALLNLNCHIALDKTEIYSEIRPFTRLLFYFFLVTLGTLCLFTYFLFRYWFLPIFRIANAIPSSPEIGNYALSKINHQLKLLTDQNESALSRLSDYQINEILHTIYTSEDLTENELLIVSQKFPHLENNFRCICLGYLNTEQYLTLDAAKLTELMNSLSITVTGGILMNNNFIGLIVQNNNMVYHESSDFYQKMNRLLECLNQSECMYAIGISDVYNGYFSVSSAYKEAYKSWKTAMLWQNAAVVYNSSLTEYASDYQVTYTQLDALYRMLLSDQKEKALELYEQLLSDNFGNLKEHRLRTLYWQQFENDIIGVLIRISTQYDIYAIIESYLSQAGQISLFKRIEYLKNTIVASIEFIPIRNSENSIADSIHKYCTLHYNDYQLSLSTLSEEFHLSPSSLSKFFKAHFGISPGAYIERMRIEQATKLIMERQFTIQEIAARVGYQNITTFYNAFKKIQKCTPTEWREQQEYLISIKNKGAD